MIINLVDQSTTCYSVYYSDHYGISYGIYGIHSIMWITQQITINFGTLKDIALPSCIPSR